MGEAKRKRERAAAQDWPRDESFRGVIEMHQLGGVPELNGARTTIWNGRRNYEHELPPEAARWVGGERVAIVQVQSPVGVNRRSSVDLTHKLSGDFDGVIHWARDTETFQSILNSFVRLDLESVSPPDLPEDWSPEITILMARGLPEEI